MTSFPITEWALIRLPKYVNFGQIREISPNLFTLNTATHTYRATLHTTCKHCKNPMLVDFRLYV